MSFFAVLDRSEPDELEEFTVEQCHINLWALRGLGPGRRRFFLDVGVRVKAGGGASLKGFSLVLPFGAEAHTDLTTLLVENRRVAELIFDSDISWPTPPPGSNFKLITIGDNDMRVMPVKTAANKGLDTGADVSVRDFMFVTPLPANETGYARVRFPLNNLGSTWQWQASSGRRTGAILDFRVLDQRSTATLDDGNELRARAKHIDTVAVFAMVPSWLHGRAINPELKYMRVLESRVWTPYLKRLAEFGDRPMVVFSWKGKDVSLDEPLRIYADFTMRRKGPSLLASLVFLALTIAAVGFVYDLPVRDGVTTSLQAVGDLIAEKFELLITGGVLAALVLGLKIPERLAKAVGAVKAARAGFRAFEELVFRRRGAQ